jgi:hypothetical protein
VAGAAVFAEVWGTEGVFPKIFAPQWCRFGVIKIFFIPLEKCVHRLPIGTFMG